MYMAAEEAIAPRRLASRKPALPSEQQRPPGSQGVGARLGGGTPRPFPAEAPYGAEIGSGGDLQPVHRHDLDDQYNNRQRCDQGEGVAKQIVHRALH